MKKFYETKWFTLIMFVLICPVGVFLMWKNKIFNKAGRIILSILVVPITFIEIVFWIAIINPQSAIEKSNQQIEIRNKESNSKSQENEIPKEEIDNSNSTTFQIEDDGKEINDEKIEKSSDLIKEIYNLYKESSEPKTEEFLRNPDSFKGKNILYTGKIIQVLEGNDEYPTNIIIENDIDGEMVNILYERKEGQPRYLVDDYITVLGAFDRIESMQNLMGQQVPVPIIDSNYIDFSYNIKRIINGCKAMDSISANYRLEMTDQTYDEPNGKSGSLFKVYYNDTKKYDSRLLYSNGVNTSWYIPETESITEYFFSNQL
ncbi:hypothetical protein [Clostridium sp.]|uniref:hypothetical protein n=1 Tax=Clostridium sp. TaxID=1506 RepID=UPI00290D9710|nr:hypothetical protein [Clostridium sp.]MDU4479726.1 hypothetical protein [Clostridium sp.]